MSFDPIFKITPALTNILMDIEASRQAVSTLPITVQVLASLRESARLTATHYSTQIEGNRLTREQVSDVLKGSTFPNRSRDEKEVKNYYQALDYMDYLINENDPSIRENDVKILHGLVMEGGKKSTPYRDGQNVIKDSVSGRIVYMPPEAKDVPHLIFDMVSWINHQRETAILPAPIIAAIAHYQFATIHPYYDGNGRTARLLTNIVLHKAGYGLKGIYSLEEYYAGNLQRYYDALTIGESQNYYFGRIEADITKWIVYFCEGMAAAFSKVRLKASETSMKNRPKADHTSLLRELGQRQKRVLSLFLESKFITTREISNLLGIHPRTALNLCKQWEEQEFLIKHGTSNKMRNYELGRKWLPLIQ